MLITFFKFLVKKERHQSVFDWLLETSKYNSRELLNQRKQMPCHISHPKIKIFITETNKKNKKRVPYLHIPGDKKVQISVPFF